MRTLFTIHAGEYLVGQHIEKKFGRRVQVWVPCKDSGVDLLVTDATARRSVSLQAKYSRDFLFFDFPSELIGPLRACGWWSIDRRKLAASRADYWVLAITGAKHRETDFLVITPRELLKRLTRLHGGARRIQAYFWVTESKRCWETRGLTRPVQYELVQGRFHHRIRDFSKFLNNWKPIERLLRRGSRQHH